MGCQGVVKGKRKGLSLEANVASVEINCFSFVLSAQMKERGSSNP